MNTMLVTPSFQNPIVKELRGLVRTRPGFEDPRVATPERAELECREVGAELVIVVIPRDATERGLEVIRKVRRGNVRYVLAIGPATDPKLILRVLRLGADLFLDETDLESELAAWLARVSGSPGGVPAGRITAVLSACGGCGASTVAANVAALKAAAGDGCHLIDLNPGKADLASLLDVVPQYSLTDLCRNLGRLDRALYEKLVVRHRCGVSLLAGPRDPGDAAGVNPAAVNQGLTIAQELYPEIVVDAENCYREEQVVALRRADAVLLVTRLDFTAVRQTRRTLDHLAAVQVPRQRVKLVVNQFGRPDELPVTDAESALGEKLTKFVPYDPAGLASATAAGAPSILDDPRGKVAAAFAELLGVAPTRPAKGLSGLFRTLLGKN